MPLTRGRSVRFGGYLHRDSIGAAPSGAAPNFSPQCLAARPSAGTSSDLRGSAGDLGALREEDRNEERTQEPDADEHERNVGVERLREAAATPRAAAGEPATGVDGRARNGE